MIASSLALTLAFMAVSQSQPPALPSTPMSFGAFTATFSDNGTFTIQGDGETFRGTYRKDTTETKDTRGPVGTLTLTATDAAGGCDRPARYDYVVSGGHVTFALVSDECTDRRMILEDRKSVV